VRGFYSKLPRPVRVGIEATGSPHQWVRMRTRIQNVLQAIALANGLRRGTSLWSRDGKNAIASLPLAPHTAYRRSALQVMYVKIEAEIVELNRRSQSKLIIVSERDC
jgi:hypothetical protein